MPLTADNTVPPTAARLANIVMAAAFMAVACVLLLASWQDEFAGFAWDDSYYLMMADQLSPYLGHKPAALSAIIHQRSYPPLYPVYLALAGGGSGAIGAAHIATTFALLAGLGLFYLWLRRELVDPVSAWCLTLAFALSLATIYHFQTLWSEHLYLAISMGCLLCAAGRHRDDASWWLAAVLAAACAATRVAGWSMVLAFSILVLAGNARPRIYLLALAIAPALAERVVNAVSGPSTPSYQGVLLEGLAQHLSFGALSATANGLWQAVVTAFGGSDIFAACALALAALAGWKRFLGRSLDAIYLLVYMAVVVVWSFPEHAFRFMYPLVPLLLFYAFIGGRAVLRLAWRGRTPLPAAIVGFLAFVFTGVPGADKLAVALAEPAPPGLEAYRLTEPWTAMEPASMRVPAARLRQAMIRDMNRLREISSDQECVYTEFPPLVQMYGQRLAVDPPWKDLGEMRLMPGGCRWYYLLPMYRNEWPRYAARLPAGRFSVVQRTAMPEPVDGIETLSFLIRF